MLHLVEDKSVIPAEIDSTSSHRVRQLLVKGNAVTHMVGAKIETYIEENQLAAKISGTEKWGQSDKTWRPEDRTYLSDFRSNERGLDDEPHMNPDANCM